MNLKEEALDCFGICYGPVERLTMQWMITIIIVAFVVVVVVVVVVVASFTVAGGRSVKTRRQGPSTIARVVSCCKLKTYTVTEDVLYMLTTHTGSATRPLSRPATKNRAMGENNLITSQKERDF